MIFHRTDRVKVVMPRAALSAVFDDCDRFDRDETGGRLVGTYEEYPDGILVKVQSVIDSGPSAQRSNVSFFQDGEYQERKFRELEEIHPKIEHLGNWHSHHVNGYPTLSGGDVKTYKRIVNHRKHNTSFFYAVLVTDKNRKPAREEERYRVKHYFFRRGDDRAYEIPESMIDIADVPLLTATAGGAPSPQGATANAPAADILERGRDSALVASSYPRMRTFASKNGDLYWRGEIELADGSMPEIIVIEDASGPTFSYAAGLRNAPDSLRKAADEIQRQRFESAHAALLCTERGCNRALFERHAKRAQRK